MMKVPQTIVEKLHYCWQRQKTRFTNMGNYKYISLFLFAFQFTMLPELLKLLWVHVEGGLPDVPFYALIILMTNALTIGGYMSFMYFIYSSKIPFFQQFRCDPNLKWPWEQDPENWHKTLLKTIRVDTINILGGVTLLYVDSIIRYDIKMTVADAPDRWTLLWQFLFFLYAEQLLFYLAHSTFHHPKLYHLHKRHHEYNSTISLAIVYSSGVEHITNIVATGLTYKILATFYPVHIFTVIIWVTFRFIESLDGHSGYDWPWAISNWVPFSSGERYHFFHHSNNVGNYGGIVYIFDTIFGTDKAFIQKQAKDAQLKLKQGKFS